MAISLRQLASKLGFTESEMEKTILELGFEVSEEIEDDIAELITDEVVGKREKSAAEVYEQLVEEEQEREIVKNQRKKTAGKPATMRKREEPRVASSKASAHDGEIEIPEMITVKELAEKTGVSAAVLIGALMKNGVLANINQQIDFETAAIILDSSKVTIRKKRGEATAEDLFLGNLEKLLKEEDPRDLKPRPPVVCVMGHVDHGKTSLLDAIRETNVVSTESGGITQHIGAYQVVKNGHKITFLDTPGHEAFTAMRARGARATDIAILVVAADDGVKPQTMEALNHAREAEVPIIVAVNKMDRPGANLDKVKAELAAHGLQPEDWGGSTMFVPVSALKKEGINELLESVLLVAEIENFRANPNRPAVGTVIESHLDLNLGPVATVLVNTGTLHVGDSFIIGQAHGRVKIMKDFSGKKVDPLLPSDTAQIAGLSATVESGQILQVVKDDRTARGQAGEVSGLIQDEIMRSGMGMSEILQRIKEGSLKLLKVVIKADTQGSLEAIRGSLAKVKSDDVAIKVIHSGVGDITESDVMMAAASAGSMVIGFRTQANTHVRKLAERMVVEVVTYDVIYHLIEDLTKILSGLLEPEILDVELGHFKVMKVFFTGDKEMVVGGKIISGRLEKKAKLRVMRDGVLVGDGELAALKLVNEDMDELEAGTECGVRYKGKVRLKEGDVFEAWKTEKKMKTLLS